VRANYHIAEDSDIQQDIKNRPQLDVTDNLIIELLIEF
jgi:hypothetical protein